MLEDLKQFVTISEGKEQELENYLTGKTLSPEGVKKFLADENQRKAVQSDLDRLFHKGIETWKQNNLTKIIDEEVSKRFPTETEEQKRLRKLEQELESERKARTVESLKNKALSFATEKGLPVSLVGYFLGHDEESTLANLAALEQVWQADVSAAVEGKFQEGGRKPVKPQDPQVLDPKKMSTKDINAKWDKMKEKLKDGKFNKT